MPVILLDSEGGILKFQVFKNGKVTDKCDLNGAYLFGTDGVAIRGADIKFIDGFVDCNKPNLQTAGLVLPWEVQGEGKVLLATTCLPERERPYNLNVEIARGKLMQIVTKREDWSLFNSDTEKISANAQQLFIRALNNISDMSASSMFADEALLQSVQFSEKLAVQQAETALKERASARGFSRGCFGCQIDPIRITEPAYIEKLTQLFSSVIIPINWGKIETTKGQYNFADIERCMTVLSNKRMAIGAGPLLCFNHSELPAWLTSGRSSFEKVRENAYKFITQIVERYRGTIRNWIVISGLNCQNHFGFSFEQILEMTRAACMAVKAANEKARKIIEVQNPWGEYYASISGTIPPLVYIDMAVQGGINFDAFALALNIGTDGKHINIRDMLQISSLLDYLSPISKPFWITKIGLMNEPLNQKGQASVPSQNQNWLNELYRIALSKPFVDAVVYSNFADRVNAANGLVTEKLEYKEVFKNLKELRKRIFQQ
ncbi:MAG: endo-1,4-beta-xylanase [Phycisphaerae bacterium]